jgi:hypothetical protein
MYKSVRTNLLRTVHCVPFKSVAELVASDWTTEEIQRVRTHLRTKLKELDFAVKTGALMDVDKVKREVWRLAREERDALLNLLRLCCHEIKRCHCICDRRPRLAVDHFRLTIALEKHIRKTPIRTRR